jgi:hypothetical protein
MLEFVKKMIKSIKVYRRYFHEALLEIYLYFTSAYPAYVFLKKWSLANRSLRILWASPRVGRKSISEEMISLIVQSQND